MSSHDTVAVLGTGIMGAPMARNLLAAGFPVRVWNRTAEKTAPLGADGAIIGASPGEAADGAQIVVTMLTDAGAGRHELDVPLVAAIAERFAQGVAAGHGDLDMSATLLAGS